MTPPCGVRNGALALHVCNFCMQRPRSHSRLAVHKCWCAARLSCALTEPLLLHEPSRVLPASLDQLISQGWLGQFNLVLS